ncbi:MAG: hypothetical protein J4G09_05535 [Proteobacteria bacterium]|nr:hypothetical protein [Pseudomonadota bacterium]
MAVSDTRELHAEAVRLGRETYLDPDTGYQVITELGHLRRGKCCGCGCRHCPFEHENVPQPASAERVQQPALINAGLFRKRSCDVLFWSGGKDSYLAWLYLRRELAALDRDVALLTTFDGRSRTVAHQEIPFGRIVEQSEALGAPLLAIPLDPRTAYLKRIEAGLELLGRGRGIERLVFGDLHLEHIRQWREESFAPLARALGLRLHFPLWGLGYAELMREFVESGASAEITAAPFGDYGGAVRVGDSFGPDFVARLPAGVDAFGERGEFHTRVSPAGAGGPRAGGGARTAP